MPDTNNRIKALKKRINKLKRCHADVTVSAKRTEKQLNKIEGELGIQFPSTYRTFLLEICSGLYSDDDYGLRNLAQTVQYARDANKIENFSKPFPFGNKDAEQAWQNMLAFRASYKEGKPDYFMSGNPEEHGVLKLFEGGSDGHFYLVLNGEQEGMIWESPDMDLWYPTNREDSEKPQHIDVLDFYENIIIELEEEMNAPLPPVNIPLDQETYGFFNSMDGELPEGVFDATHLKMLVLSSNNLKSVPLLPNMQNVEDLDLSFNKFKKVPEEILSLKKLKYLQYAGNKVKVLPDWFGELENLEILRIWENKLESLPESLNKLKKLQKIDLHSNPIKTVPEVLYTCESLVKVSLRDTLVPKEEIDKLQEARPDLEIIS